MMRYPLVSYLFEPEANVETAAKFPLENQDKQGEAI